VAQRDEIPERVVFLGDSIADSFVYPRLARQGLTEAGIAAPVFTCAGVGGDTVWAMRRRLERDVLHYAPQTVVLNGGVNDLFQDVPLGEFETHLLAILAELRRAGTALILVTPSILGGEYAERNAGLLPYDDVIRRIAETKGHPLADAGFALRTAAGEGQTVIDEDEVHPNLLGHRLFARVVLDAMGHPEIPVPDALDVEPMPGTVESWCLGPAPLKSRLLDADAVAALAPEADWVEVDVPERAAFPHWEQEVRRRTGFVQALGRFFPEAKKFRGVADVVCEAPRKAFVNTGGYLLSAWLNGERFFRSRGWTGYHAGKERIPVALVEGANRLVVETGADFFLSLTDTDLW